MTKTRIIQKELSEVVNEIKVSEVEMLELRAKKARLLLNWGIARDEEIKDGTFKDGTL